MKPWLWLTAASDSHTPMLMKHFLPSWGEHLEPFCELQWEPLRGDCGKFGEEAFNEMGRASALRMAKKVRDNIGRKMVVSGCDFRFYSPFIGELEAALEGHDVVGINDIHGPVCGDFLAFVASAELADLFQWIYDHDRSFSNEQFTLNAGLSALGLRAHLLPDTFWTYGLEGRGPWAPGAAVHPPANIRLHHANWTIGAENKMTLLDAVQAALQKEEKARPENMVDQAPMA